MYCSINEAWGNNKIDNKIDNNVNNNVNNNIELKQKIIENYNDEFKNINCDKFINHIVDCKECQKKLLDKFCKIPNKPLIDINYFDIETRETIIIFFIGLIIIITLNLFFN